MGSCCSKQSRTNRSELENPLLHSQDLPPDSKVLIISLRACANLRAADVTTSDPYVIFSVRPNQEGCDSQEQFSSCKANNLNPVWAPPEKFQFIITDPSRARLIISVLDHDDVGEDDNLGDAMLPVKEYANAIGRDQEIRTLQLIDASSGNVTTSSIELGVQLLTREEALSIQEHFVYEYERWQAVTGWGNSHLHLLPGVDPGKWSDVRGEVFSEQFDDVAPPVPSDQWVVTEPWSYTTTQGDPEGYQYSTNFVGFDWSDEKHHTHVVRRRLWRREVRLQLNG